ncbi:MAG: serine hydrolase [Pyrinomonadaceae bacterium]|nr:serine hydrolase [Pyrinomonadaceae bacterium]
MLERFIAHEMSDKELPALSIALVDDQQIVYAKGFDFDDPKSKTPATAETVYRVGSVSKLLTDIAVMQLVEIDHVLVNGQVVIEHGRHTGARPGQVLYGPGRRLQ